MNKFDFKNLNIKKLFESKLTGNLIIVVSAFVLVYLVGAIYFSSHFFFNTEINGIDVSLKSHKEVEEIIKNGVKGYNLTLIERDGVKEEIVGQAIELKYNDKNSYFDVCRDINIFKWGISLFKKQRCYVEDLFAYNKVNLENRINQLGCLNKEIIEPKNVSFIYKDGSYEVVKEVYGNKINKANLEKAIEKSILRGETTLDLNEGLCYDNPKYTLNSDITAKTKKLLNEYISSRIIYLFGDKSEVLDSDTINKWLSVDDKLEVVVDEKALKEYVNALSKKYDTIGIARKFKTSVGKTLEVSGGFYGWKINRDDEAKKLLEIIKIGRTLEREPIYAQKGVTRGENDIGNTYVEINITQQHLWFYKNGKLVTQGDVVTGNPNVGNSTKLGIYMLNYKQKGSTLRGENYESDVTYWMPFNGNIGIHDASWRYSFGGDIYKSNGTHGCVNCPLYLAKTIFENIEPGTPIICYEE
ncbi:L,D-transpeptidase family protein [Clostridium fungisolvens]|uniref:L,D-TPase catalytic domain-containing protein n=1 Tax=Clostridium fungisolvens TaxID=1604897 RepID=A0A6V8SBL4_9CLOT|nr:peptidoglycan binding domain-containing protein [Clostridium fungisolvens]GFP74607.1 hypothetical protein bsdtw1_00662 [Clostridium fungisolvens]